MKNLAVVLVLFFSVSGLWAQGNGGGQRMSIEERQKQELKQLKSALDLNEAQEKQIVTLQEAFAKETQTLRSGMSQNSDRSAMREKMSTLRKQYDTDVKAVLTDEQKVKYEKLIAKRKEQSQQKGQRQSQGQGKKRQRN